MKPLRAVLGAVSSLVGSSSREAGRALLGSSTSPASPAGGLRGSFRGVLSGL